MMTHREMHCAAQAIYALERTLPDFQRKRDTNSLRGQQLDIICEHLNQALASLRQEVDFMAQIVGGIPPIDLRGCKNSDERLHKVAMTTKGIIYLPDFLDVLESSWPTDARRDSLRSEVRRWMRVRPHEWEKVAPETYRYKCYESSGESQDDEHH